MENSQWSASCPVPPWPGRGRVAEPGLSRRDSQRMSRQAQLSREHWGMGRQNVSLCVPSAFPGFTHPVDCWRGTSAGCLLQWHPKALFL